MKKRKDGLYQKRLPKKYGGKMIYGKTLKEVERKFEEIKQENLATSSPMSGDKLFCEVLEEWRETHFSNLRYNTKVCYNSALLDLNDAFSENKLNEITAVQVQEFINELTAKNLARQTVKCQ